MALTLCENSMNILFTRRRKKNYFAPNLLEVPKELL